ncbi:cbb3-type cytochrome c oxidase subunit I [uncultured Bartonella sp.]|uniref:cbb3-type cytochrome c oxidase subunit I n=1 Tax=uncultured Bartonella sp. TaxID=104108 RepID=UPI002626E9B7|nr:cbb3-type cytochrome c oxidase subunit I [uncultured Bartonella sp.]
MSERRNKSFFSSIIDCDNRAIGTLYLVVSIIAGVIGAAFSIILRLALNGADLAFLSIAFPSDPAQLSFMNMAHALILVFFMVMPALVGGFANWFVPLMVGTHNVAFPRLNLAAFLLLPLSILFGFFALFSIADSGQFKILMLASIFLGSVSFILTFINFITTIITMRAPGMTLSRLPIFVWSVLIASFLGLISVPAMLAALTEVIWGGVTTAGHPSMIVWFFSHPEIYVLLLPAFGIVSEILVTFCKRGLWMENCVIAAMTFIGGIGVVLWMNDLFHFQNPLVMERYFKVALPLIILPTGFILLSWLVTIVKSRFAFSSPLLWAMGFIFVVLMGQLSALQLVLSGLNVNELGQSVFVAHFHYILSLSAVFAIFAGWYYWLPKITGFSCRNATTALHFWLMFVGVNAIFLPQHLNQLGEGVLFSLAVLGVCSTVGALLATFSVIVFLYGVGETFVRGERAPNNPWGEGALTLEWQLPSPPNDDVWVKVPVVVE